MCEPIVGAGEDPRGPVDMPRRQSKRLRSGLTEEGLEQEMEERRTWGICRKNQMARKRKMGLQKWKMDFLLGRWTLCNWMMNLRCCMENTALEKMRIPVEKMTALWSWNQTPP